ncbi:MAG: N-6 DNA methylase, partial [Sedimentisphaerales bacterium]|nr:N-6 DNA methylase [Sedimentisphaerales bacterium]
MSVPKQISALVETFARNRETYTSLSYNETQLRREFLDPLFVALGWDVNNTSGYAEAYKDVIHEDSIKIGSATKAPDYCFRIGGTRKFFLEAKKPAINIKHDIHPAFQLRRYAWSAKLPLSILTDFEEFAVYDGRVRPVKTDKAATARVKYIKYNEYPDRWDEIADIFSRNAILKGSFDKYAESTRRKKGTAEVDAAFLAEIEMWRDSLARNIALRNPGLTNRELNFAVQRTVDRILFLRMCEDRGIEIYGQLLGLVNGGEVYKRLCAVFRRADEKYNSGLFYFEQEKGRSERPDELTPGLTIDDKVLSPILKRLYYPDSPYEFSVLPAEILGNVYEQFLGKVITLTKGHRAKVEDKPEVKKAGGVYYTPTYIVEYIVKNTVGKLLEGKTPNTAAKLKILDPACGSGSFLIGAYQYLLDWHLRYYTENGPEQWAKKKNPRVYQNKIDEWKLTTGERKRILLNNIYGVDIDTQAVEVTKLSLLLKVLEGENQASLDNQLRLFHERALPDLSDNIKCGNSLIGPDFYDTQQSTLFDEAEMRRINVFDWNDDVKGFGGIMKCGGFDCVIGNP